MGSPRRRFGNGKPVATKRRWQNEDDSRPAFAYRGFMPSEETTGLQERPSELEIRSVLLLEDDVELSIALKALLEARDFMVTTVTNGVDGLREILALDFDAIVCDLMMPKMPGDIFYAAVGRAKPHLCKRFIFITGHGSEPKVAEFISKVHGLVLHKPFAADDLVRMIDRAAGRRHE
jgi:DNA-binding NtrC family response regulator